MKIKFDRDSDELDVKFDDSEVWIFAAIASLISGSTTGVAERDANEISKQYRIQNN